MNENDIKGILWLLEEIEKDKIIASYFREGLNLHHTDLSKLINQFRDICKMLDNPTYIKGDEIDVPMIPNIRIEKK